MIIYMVFNTIYIEFALIMLIFTVNRSCVDNRKYVYHNVNTNNITVLSFLSYEYITIYALNMLK